MFDIRKLNIVNGLIKEVQSIHGLKFKFYEAGIPYLDIDKEMIDILDLLNFKLKMKTKFCCAGHFYKNRTLKRWGTSHKGVMSDCYICFHETMDDKYMLKLIKKLDKYHIINNYDIRKDTLIQDINRNELESIKCWCLRFPKFEPMNNQDEHIEWYNQKKEIMFNNLYNILQNKYDNIVYDSELSGD